MSAFGRKQTFTDFLSGKIFFTKIGERQEGRNYIDEGAGLFQTRCNPLHYNYVWDTYRK